jgi:hypothetical protein
MTKLAAVAVTLFGLTRLAAAQAPGDTTTDALSAPSPAITPIAAATAPVPAPVLPPQNEDWSNVSHINGQIVKVGERGDYLIKYKHTNIAANPFGPFFGYYDVSASYGVTQNVALSGAVSVYSKNGSSWFQATASVPVFFRRTYSGPYLEPGLIVRTTSNNYSYDCAGCGSGSSTTSTGPELLLGWQWSFDSGLNIAWAAGVTKDLTSNSESSEPGFNGYFRVGYAF